MHDIKNSIANAMVAVALVGGIQKTSDAMDEHRFKVPTPRSVTLTAPNMQNANVPFLEEACRVMASTQPDLDLTDDDVSDLIEFMAPTKPNYPEITRPRLPSRAEESVIASFETSVNSNETKKVNS